jgi:hypothetical protein
MLNFSYGMVVVEPPEILGLKLKTNKQKEALPFVLGNIWKHQTDKVYIRLRNQRNMPSTYNPACLGHKPIVAVLYALQDLGLIHVDLGVSRYTRDEDSGFKQSKLSSFSATPEFAELLRESIPRNNFFERPSLHVIYKDMSDNYLNFEWCEFTRRTEDLMAEYCAYMREQTLTLNGELLSEFHVPRTFRDWAGDGSFLYGGRAGESFMSLKSKERAKIKINGKKTVSLDYPASEPNILYQMMTGERLSPHGDPYEVDGLERKAVKRYFTIMLNTKGIFGAQMAIENWLLKKSVKPEKKAPAIAAEKKLGSKKAVIEAIVKRNQPIASCLMRGKAMGQHYQWLEACLVFHVAHQLSLAGIPALTVHDEFIVKEADKDVAEMVMYKAWPKNLPTLPEAPWNCLGIKA